MNREGYCDKTAEKAIARADKEARGKSSVLKSCMYCGKIHDKKNVCKEKKKATTSRYKIDTDQVMFRNTSAWKKESLRIRARDRNMCQSCFNNLGSSGKRIYTKKLSVHHIIPLAEDTRLAMDDEWLITLCPACHEEAESGAIKRSKLHEIARANNTR